LKGINGVPGSAAYSRFLRGLFRHEDLITPIRHQKK